MSVKVVGVLQFNKTAVLCDENDKDAVITLGHFELFIYDELAQKLLEEATEGDAEESATPNPHAYCKQ